MARPKNLEGRAEVHRAAFRLFMEQGYTATTYADIAAAIGKERTTVQGFFPKKELLAMDFENGVVLGNEQFARDEGLLQGEPVADFYVIGQLNISFHVKDKGMRRFTRDVLSDRALTMRTLAFNEEWVERFMGAAADDRLELMANYAIAQGGGNELLFMRLAEGDTVDVFSLVSKIITAFTALEGIPAMPAPAPLPREIIEKSNAFIEARLLS